MKKSTRIPDVIVETEAVALVREEANTSLLTGYASRLIGRSGTGKTCAMWHVAHEMGGIYCEVTTASKNPKGMMEMLLRAAGYRSSCNSISGIIDDVVHEYSPQVVLRGGKWIREQRLLFVDEIQTAEAPALRELLRVQEQCQFGLVLAGNEERLAGGNKDAATLKQIVSRIMPPCHLPGPSLRDCELIGASFGVEGIPAYKVIASFGTGTDFRELDKLLILAKSLTAGTTGIRLEHVEKALRFMNQKEVLKHIGKEVA